MPIIRVGNLAAMPEEKVRVEMWGNHVDIEAFLIEARSIGGLSGSPVFSHLGQVRVIDGQLKMREKPALHLLGLVHGHWSNRFSVEDTQQVEPYDIETFNMGIVVVVPAVKIREVLTQPDIIHGQRASEQRLLDAAGTEVP